MKIAFLKERRIGETRVACTPEKVKKLNGLGYDVFIEESAGDAAYFADADYTAQGAKIAPRHDVLNNANIVVKIASPLSDGEDEISILPENSLLICQLNARSQPALLQSLANKKINAIALEMMPRISRAQSMDILSSQANLAGYKAVLDALSEYSQAAPMMMTAAGTVAPAKIMIMGIGVAGLQAIATAKRLGAVVSATDVRPATKEQAESLGAKFIAVEDEEFAQAQSDAGYAKPMSPEYQEKQKALISETIKKQDIVITTALIPGRPAPELINQQMVESMQRGSVILDMAVETGGNCALSQSGQIIDHHGIKIIGHANIPARIPQSASQMFAANIVNFLTPYTKDSQLDLDLEDDIIKTSLVVHNGKVLLEGNA